MSGKTYWMTGLPCSGKSTIAKEALDELQSWGHHFVWIDGDVIRPLISADLGFSREDRLTHLQRVAGMAKHLNEHGLCVLVSLISPFDEGRKAAQERIGEDRFRLVFVDTPPSVCEKRDVKGMWAHARANKISEFTGVSSGYEIPSSIWIALSGTDDRSAHALAKKILIELENLT